jgi:hypothetical protein
MFPPRVKLLSLLQKLFSPTLFTVFTEVPRMILFDAVRLCFTQLLSQLWSDRICPFSVTPVSLLTRIYLCPLHFGFDANFFVLVIFKHKLNTGHTYTLVHETKHNNSIPLSIEMAGCETLQSNISLYIEERNVPQTQNPRNFSLFLLECIKWACPTEDITSNNNLWKFKEMSDFNKSNVNWRTQGRGI